jgi:phosphoketolase
MCAATRSKGNINTPLELAISNEIDRFSLVIDVINRVLRLQVAGAHVKENCGICRLTAATMLMSTASTSRMSMTGSGRCQQS